MPAALERLKVLDLTHHIAGPYCTKLLADFGAEVTKVERPESGDPARSMGPFAGDDPHPDKSLSFLYLNTNKRSITLNLKSGRRTIDTETAGVGRRRAGGELPTSDAAGFGPELRRAK